MEETMTDRLHFRVNGIPKAQPRGKAFYNKNTGRAGVYDPGTSNAWKQAVILQTRQHITTHFAGEDCPWREPIQLDLVITMPRPQRLNRRRDPEGRIPYDGREDIDNLLKSTMDALTMAGVWHDDRQVYRVSVLTLYAAKPSTGMTDASPGAHIVISRGASGFGEGVK